MKRTLIRDNFLFFSHNLDEISINLLHNLDEKILSSLIL